MWSILLYTLFILLVLGVATAVGVIPSSKATSNRRIPLASLFQVDGASRRRSPRNARITSSGIAVAPVIAATASKTVSHASSTPFQVFVQTILDARRHLTAAAVARSTSIFLMYPADVFKTRLQMKQANAFRLTGLFNGVTGSLFGQVPYGVLTFGSYEMYKSFLLDRWPSFPPIFKYAMGM
jgi:Mitochondrial carrier protein